MLADVSHLATPATYKMLQQLYSARPKTQKARGLHGLISGHNACSLSRYNYGSIFWMSCRDNLGAIPDERPLVDVLKPYSYYSLVDKSLIARPCPITPRHGFVESRIVKTVGELRTVCRETYAADPRGEVLLMPFLEEATHSAVLTNQGLSVGSGHDGATAGKDAVLIPCHSNIALWLDTQLGDVKRPSPSGTQYVSRSRYIGYTKDQKRQPYLELVGNTIVQARYGPMADIGATSYYPKLSGYVRFSEVWEPSTAMLSDFSLFETTLREKILSARDSVLCLYLPHGTLSCHAAVQGICYGAAVVTGPEKPLVDRAIHVTKTGFPGHTLLAINEKMQEGLLLGQNTTLSPTDRGDSVTWAAAVIQGMAGVPFTPQSVKFLSTAVTILLRAGLMACFGEHRHLRDNESFGDKQTPIGPLSPALRSPFNSKPVLCGRSLYYNSLSRTTLLGHKTLHVLLGKLQAIESDFNDCNWQASIGGPAWGNCTQAVKLMLIAYMRLKFRQPPSSLWVGCRCNDKGNFVKELRAAIAASNRLLTVSHNNGKCLTKFVAMKTLSGITQAPGLYLMHPLTHEVIRESSKSNELQSDSAGTNETMP